MAQSRPLRPSNEAHFPATARLRAGILIAPDAEALVAMFADALAEHGVGGHFCLKQTGGALVPLLGDCPELIGKADSCLVVDAELPLLGRIRVLLAKPDTALDSQQTARLRGYAELYAARAMALQEMADDVETECGLSLRERYVLGRRLAGLAPVDIAGESGLAVATVSEALDSAVIRLGATTVADAISLAARRGWLAVTSLENCSSSPQKLTYKSARGG